MKDRLDIDESFKQSIQKRIEDINIDISEVALDSFINNEILKEIPIIKSVISLTNIGFNIRSHFLIKKLYKFLFELNSITIEEKMRFVEKLENDKTKKNVYNNLLTLIDRIDTEEKMSVMGKILRAMILEEITIDIGFRLFNIIEKAYFEDLVALEKKYGNNKFNYSSDEYWFNEVKDGLFNLGLLAPVFKIDTSEIGRLHWGEPKVEIKDYEITYIGRQLVKHGFQ